MVGGVLASSTNGRQYEGKVTSFMLVTCLVAAMGGLILGYDLGITGGVISMEPFLVKFFPDDKRPMKDESGSESQYCKFNNLRLSLFISLMYLPGIFTSTLASITTFMFGRKGSMFVGGLFFLVTSLLSCFAVNFDMLLYCRIYRGFGVGYLNESIPIYLSEMAPAKIRGALDMGFRMMIAIGILVANLINYWTANLESGWRISLGVGAIPAIMFCIGSLFLDDTPSSMIARDQKQRAMEMLQKIRGIDNVDEEFQDLIDASEEARKVEYQSWKNFTQTRYMSQLILVTLIPFFQHLTGINAIMFYAPILFKTLVFGNDASLMSTVISGAVNVLATFVSIFTVDKFGRRILFLQGGIQMFICQIVVGTMIAIKFGANGEGSFTKNEANFFLFFVCMYVAAFAWSWGPLGWLVSSKICSLEFRSAGQSANGLVNMFFTFVIAQFFHPALCYFKFELFFIFAGFVLIMTIFIALFLPKTKKIPSKEMSKLWKSC